MTRNSPGAPQSQRGPPFTCIEFFELLQCSNLSQLRFRVATFIKPFHVGCWGRFPPHAGVRQNRLLLFMPTSNFRPLRYPFQHLCIVAHTWGISRAEAGDFRHNPGFCVRDWSLLRYIAFFGGTFIMRQLSVQTGSHAGGGLSVGSSREKGHANLFYMYLFPGKLR